MLGGLVKYISLGAQIHLERHDDGFAQRVDRRVGDLREFLPEIIVKRAFLSRQHRHGRVVTHRAHRLIAGLCQRAKHLIALLKAHLKHLLVNVELRPGDRRHRLAFKAALD